MRHNKYEYDAFISHAVEDKIPIANELCARLEAAGLNIWYSGKELGVGDSIEKTIQNGLNRSRYGIVIFSPTYLAKNWTIREFYTLLAKEIEEQKVILPVLYNTTLDELKNKDLLMADRFAVNADRGLDFVVERLVKEIRKSKAATVSRRPWLSKIGFLLLLSLLANALLLTKNTFFSSGGPSHPSQEFHPVQNQNTVTGNEEFFGEVQNILNQMNHRACNRDPQSATGEENIRSAQKNIPVVAGDSGSSKVKKMTMAVIFQMEVPDNSAPEAGQEGVAARSDAMSMEKENESFIHVSNHDIPVTRQRVSRSYTADLAE